MIQDFTLNYDLYQAAIARYCSRRCRDEDIGQELMQETFLRFWLCLQREESILYVRAFLYRVAHNLIIDHVRRKKEASLEQLLETGYEPSVDLWNETFSQLDAERLLKKLGTMRNCYRQVLHRRYILGLPPTEIGKITGESANIVSVRIFRGLKQLRFAALPVA